MKKPSKKS